MSLLGCVAALCMNACAQTWTYMCMTEKNKSAVLVKRKWNTRAMCLWYKNTLYAVQDKSIPMHTWRVHVHVNSHAHVMWQVHMRNWHVFMHQHWSVLYLVRNVRLLSSWGCYLQWRFAVSTEQDHSCSCSAVEGYFSFASQGYLTWFWTQPLLKDCYCGVTPYCH